MRKDSKKLSHMTKLVNVFISIISFPLIIQSQNNIVVSKEKSCKGETMQIRWLQTPSPVNVKWNFGDGASPDTIMAAGNAVIDVQYSTPGQKTISARATFSGGHTENQTKIIRVSELLQQNISLLLRFHPSASLILYASASVDNVNSLTPQKFLWRIDNNSSSLATANFRYTYTFQNAGNYPVHLMVEDDGGCRVEIDTSVTVLEAVFRAPNVFTPNQDGVNDLFIIQSPGNIRYTFEIYDRWGSLVYKPNLTGTQLTWDGRNNAGELVMPGVYFYVVTPEDPTIKPLRGFVYVFHEER